MGHYYILIMDHSVGTKEGAFFEETFKNESAEKRAAWERIEAPDLNEARQIAIAIRRWRYPTSGKTLGEPNDSPREPRTIWEKAEASASEMRNEHQPLLQSPRMRR